MPGKRRAGSRRARAPRPAEPHCKVMDLALGMEVPLNDAIDCVHALRLIGHGLTADHDDAGRPITSIAWAATDRLDELKRAWAGLLKAARQRTTAR